MKQGSRVPIMTGSYTIASGQNQEVQYLDVGITAEASLENAGDRIRLRTKLEQTGVAEEKSSTGIQDPIIRQSVLENESLVAPGKPIWRSAAAPLGRKVSKITDGSGTNHKCSAYLVASGSEAAFGN